MRPLKDIREAIGHAKLNVKPQADEAVRRDLLAELAAATAGQPTTIRPRGWGMALKTIAAAAVIFLAVVIVDRRPREGPTPPAEIRTQSAADLLTVGSLNMACRRGGLDAVDRLCEEADRRLGVGPEKVSIRAFTREFKGT